MDGLFFDLDNTLLDRARALDVYLERLTRRFPETFGPAELRELRELDAAGMRGRPGFCRLVAQRFPVLGAPAEVWEDFASGLTQAVQPDPRVLALLDQLQPRYRLAVVTNGSSRRQREKLRRAGLQGRFDHLFISEEVGAEKPDPAIFRHALRESGLSAGEVLFVGDDPRRDIVGAGAVGLRTCWVAHGRTYPAELPRPLMTVDRVEHLVQMIGG